jgi:hypothetical protein
MRIIERLMFIMNLRYVFMILADVKQRLEDPPFARPTELLHRRYVMLRVSRLYMSAKGTG